MLTAAVSKDALSDLSPREIRALTREGRWQGRSESLAPGHVQANVTVLPRDTAFDFLLFCQRNPKPCPLLEVTDPGSPLLCRMADADLRTDLSRYQVFEKGRPIDEPENILELWQEDWVGFLLGCSDSFETALLSAGVSLRHIEENRSAPIYETNLPCTSAGRFSGPLLVSMRPIRSDQAVRAIQVTSRLPAAHGAPVHIGDPSAMGIDDLADTRYGTDPMTIGPDEVPLFWACAFTPQAAALAAGIDFMITHKPGHLFITDRLTEEVAAL